MNQREGTTADKLVPSSRAGGWRTVQPSDLFVEATKPRALMTIPLEYGSMSVYIIIIISSNDDNNTTRYHHQHHYHHHHQLQHQEEQQRSHLPSQPADHEALL